MSDSATQSDTQKEVLEEQTSTTVSSPPTSYIWTPRFIGIFALVLIVGLSSASLLTRGWVNNFYRGEWVLLVQTAGLFCCWSAGVVLARSQWVRLGSIFGCIWTLFTATSFVINLLPVNFQFALAAHLNAATNSALLCSYICLSIARVPFRRWDSWFFKIGPIVGIGAIVATRILSLSSVRTLEGPIAAVALFFCVLVWWLRPSCWSSQPSPTLLFGLAPLLLILLTIANAADAEANFFFSQIVLLCILLGVIRVLQGELRNA